MFDDNGQLIVSARLDGDAFTSLRERSSVDSARQCSYRSWVACVDSIHGEHYILDAVQGRGSRRCAPRLSTAPARPSAVVGDSSITA